MGKTYEFQKLLRVQEVADILGLSIQGYTTLPSEKVSQPLGSVSHIV